MSSDIARLLGAEKRPTIDAPCRLAPGQQRQQPERKEDDRDDPNPCRETGSRRLTMAMSAADDRHLVALDRDSFGFALLG